MVTKFIIFFSVLPMLVWGTHMHHDTEQPGTPDFCLNGPYHKAAPSIEDQDEIQECLLWSKDVSCCNAALTESIGLHKARQLYNYSWDLCGTLSAKCEEFIKDEKYFYQCEPMLRYFEIGKSGYIRNMPVCADYCDTWFEACKDDLTCVENWLRDFAKDPSGNNTCPVNSTCITFEEMYSSGEGPCNRMWGDAFHYSTDTDNCTVMEFNNSTSMINPNTRLSFPETSTSSTNGSIRSTVMYGSVLIIMLIIAANV